MTTAQSRTLSIASKLVAFGAHEGLQCMDLRYKLLSPDIGLQSARSAEVPASSSNAQYSSNRGLGLIHEVPLSHACSQMDSFSCAAT